MDRSLLGSQYYSAIVAGKEQKTTKHVKYGTKQCNMNQRRDKRRTGLPSSLPGFLPSRHPPRPGTRGGGPRDPAAGVGGGSPEAGRAEEVVEAVTKMTGPEGGPRDRPLPPSQRLRV